MRKLWIYDALMDGMIYGDTVPYDTIYNRAFSSVDRNDFMYLFSSGFVTSVWKSAVSRCWRTLAIGIRACPSASYP